MPTETDMVITDHRTNILDAVAMLFCKYSIRSLQIPDIIRKLEIPRNIFLQYFSDKNELIRAVFENQIGKRKLALELLMKSESDNVLEQALKGRTIIVGLLREIPKKTVYEIKKYYPEIYEQWENFIEQWLVDICKKNLIAGIHVGLYRKSINIELIAGYLVHLLIHNAMNALPVSKNYSENEIRSQIAEFELSAICTEKGSSLLRKLLK